MPAEAFVAPTAPLPCVTSRLGQQAILITLYCEQKLVATGGMNSAARTCQGRGGVIQFYHGVTDTDNVVFSQRGRKCMNVLWAVVIPKGTENPLFTVCGLADGIMTPPDPLHCISSRVSPHICLNWGLFQARLLMSISVISLSLCRFMSTDTNLRQAVGDATTRYYLLVDTCRYPSCL